MVAPRHEVYFSSYVLLLSFFILYTPSLYFLFIDVGHNTTQHHAASRSITQHHAAPRSTTRHHTTPRNTTQHHAASRSITQHHATSRSTILYHSAPPCTTLHHAASFHSLLQLLTSLVDPSNLHTCHSNMSQSQTTTSSPPIMISVLMCVHNGALHLAEAIESILNQSMSQFQFVIVDDASTDESRAVSVREEEGEKMDRRRRERVWIVEHGKRWR